MTGRGASTTGSPTSGKVRQTSKQYQDERIGTNLYGIPEGFEDKVQAAEEIVVTGTRSARAPLDGWWRGIDFTPEQEQDPAPAANGYYTTQPSAWMQNIQALGSQPQRLPTYNEVLALENSGGYAWEAGPTAFERWEQRQTELGMAYIANSMIGSGAVASLGSRAAGGSLEDQVAWGQLASVLEGAAGGMVGTQGLAPRGYTYVAPAGVRAMDRNPLPTLSRLRVESTSPMAARAGIGNAEALGIPNFLSTRQSLHIPPVSDGRSVLTANPTELLRGLHEGSFTILRQPKPGQVVVDFGSPIGEYWQGGVRVGESQFGVVSYGRRGAHIYPANPNQW